MTNPADTSIDPVITVLVADSQALSMTSHKAAISEVDDMAVCASAASGFAALEAIVEHRQKRINHQGFTLRSAQLGRARVGQVGVEWEVTCLLSRGRDKCVGRCDHPAQQRRRLAGQPVGVTGPVPALVMRSHDRAR